MVAMDDRAVVQVVAASGFERMQKLSEDHHTALKNYGAAVEEFTADPSLESAVLLDIRRLQLERAENALQALTGPCP